MRNSFDWLFLVATLPTAQTTSRMRLWRSLKACGAASMKDGVYLLPNTPAAKEAFTNHAQEVVSAGGEAWLLRADALFENESAAWRDLFDRTNDYRALIDEVKSTDPREWPPAHGTRRLQALWRRHAQIVQTDHFPGDAMSESQAALEDLQAAWLRVSNPEEPHATATAITRLDPARYVARVWATRRRPWVDRLASAWLIRRHIDPQASFRWLEKTSDCAPDWLGFDFDGAAFTHVEARVTFESLLASFGLEDTGSLARIGELVHFLDVGGAPVPQASGIEAALAGLRDYLTNDDQLLEAACAVFDGLHRSFEASNTTKEVSGP